MKVNLLLAIASVIVASLVLWPVIDGAIKGFRSALQLLA
jgi:hypothetical protein